MKVEIGVEYQTFLLLLLFFNVAVKWILGHLQDIESWVISTKNIAEQFKKVNKHFKTWHKFQNYMTRPNDMIHTLIAESVYGTV